MKKIGFVAPWYGETIPGGAEADLRGIVHHIKDRGYELEILTTCIKDFNSDWGTNAHAIGITEEAGITVRRFPVEKRDKQAFDLVNEKLMRGIFEVEPEEERTYIEEMIRCPQLALYIKECQEEYSAFVYTPYMFSTTYYGILACPQKALIIPCFHDEAYIHLQIFKDVFSKAAGIVFHAKPEYEMIQKLYDLSNVKCRNIGDGLDVNLQSNADRFRDKYAMESPFILYAGRKDAGKNIYLLIDYFMEYKTRHANSDLKLILLGGGNVDIPQSAQDDIIDLGYIAIQDKYDAYAAATVFCQPSPNESFSLVIMESWLCKRPVLVYEKCAVTANFVRESNGGLYFKNYFDFEGTIDYIIGHEDIAKQMGENGCRFVKNNFAWEVIIDKYLEFIKEIATDAE